jgi:hypothetical protein
MLGLSCLLKKMFNYIYFCIFVRWRIETRGVSQRISVLQLTILIVILASPLSAVDPRELKLPSRADIDAAMARGVDFLIADQNKDGSKNLNIYAPVPGAHLAFRSATTALCIAALIESGAADSNDRARHALERGETWLLEELPKVRRADGTAIYNVWSHAYGIHALVAMHRRETKDAARRAKIKEVIATQVDRLGRYESVDGGWGYYDFKAGAKQPSSDSISFVNAAALLPLHEARALGVEVPEKLVQRAIAATKRQQKDDFSYLYGEYLKNRPMAEINRPSGSLGRSQACNLALRVWGETNVTDTVMTNWLHRLVVRNEWLSFGRKRPIPHESWAQVAGYFYYFGHYYGALTLDQIPPAEAAKYAPQIAALLLPLQEKDGSWWDYPLYNYHQQYGTAYALLSLTRCRR